MLECLRQDPCRQKTSVKWHPKGWELAKREFRGWTQRCSESGGKWAGVVDSALQNLAKPLSGVLLQVWPPILPLSQQLVIYGAEGACNTFCKSFLSAGYSLILGPTLLECSFINFFFLYCYYCRVYRLVINKGDLGYASGVHDTMVPRCCSAV